VARDLPKVEGVTHRFAKAGGRRNHLAVAGEGEPVILLHGWPQHWYAWRKVMPRLAGHYQAIALDLRGFGWTDIAWTGLDKESMATDVLEVLDALGLDRVRLVGHDWGAWIALILALRHPGRVQQVVALNAPPPWPRPSLRRLLWLRRFAYQLAISAPFLGHRLVRRQRFVRRLVRGWSKDGIPWSKRDAKIFLDELQSPIRARASVILYRTFLTRELFPVLAGRYRDMRLEPPALLMTGKGDPVAPPHLLADAPRQADDLRVETISRAGHFLPEERPEEVAERLLEFFEGSSRPAAVAARAE
jgi:pimeloyl-ACP methyl ester carboxylesterase